MNDNLKPLYKLIEGKVNQYNIGTFLESSIAIGIENFFKYEASISKLENEIDYAELLIEALDSEVFNNKNFMMSLIDFFLDEIEINKLCRTLNIDPNRTNTEKRDRIKALNKNNLKNAFLETYEFDSDYFKEDKPDPEIFSETIVPFTPIKCNDSELPEEYLSLHDYQKRVKDRLVQQLMFSEPNNKMLVHMPTGSGKTKTAIEAIIDFIRVKLRPIDGGGKIVWFAHSKELCEQAYQTLKKTWLFKGDYAINTYKLFGNSDINEVINCTNDKVAVIFIGFQKFNAISKSNDEISKKLFIHIKDNTRLAVVDEAHISLANTYRNAIEVVTHMPDCRLVGLTATPGRNNYMTGDSSNDELAQFFLKNFIRITDDNNIPYENPLKTLRDQEYLAQIESIELDFNLNIFDDSITTQKITNVIKKDDIDQEVLEKISINPERNKLIIQTIKKRYDNNESILLFACTTNHCKILQKLLSKINIESKVILGSTPNSNRSQIIDDFKNRKLMVLINYGVLTTGFDAPRLNTLMIVRPTKSIVLYSQMVGRALRGENNGGNKCNTLITIKDNMIGFPDPDFMFSYWDEFWN